MSRDRKRIIAYFQDETYSKAWSANKFNDLIFGDSFRSLTLTNILFSTAVKNFNCLDIFSFKSLFRRVRFEIWLRFFSILSSKLVLVLLESGATFDLPLKRQIFFRINTQPTLKIFLSLKWCPKWYWQYQLTSPLQA